MPQLPFDDWRFLALVVCLLFIARQAVRRLRAMRERPRTQLLECLDSALIAIVLVCGVIQPCVAQTCYIPSESMRNTLVENDRILVNRWVYRMKAPKRGDVVVFRAPKAATPDEKDYVKRIVAVEGDLVAVRGGVLHLNGEPQGEPYVRQLMDYDFPPEPYTSLDREKWGKLVEIGELTCVRVPPGAVLAFGDNRNNSHDGHVWGFLSTERLKGRAMAIYWPPGRVRLLR